MAGQTAPLSPILQVTGHTSNTRFTPLSGHNKMMKKIHFFFSKNKTLTILACNPNTTINFSRCPKTSVIRQVRATTMESDLKQGTVTPLNCLEVTIKEDSSSFLSN